MFRYLSPGKQFILGVEICRARVSQSNGMDVLMIEGTHSSMIGMNSF